MVGGAHGQVGRHAKQLVVAVKRIENTHGKILLSREVEMIALVATASNKFMQSSLISWTFALLKCCSIAVDGGWGSRSS